MHALSSKTRRYWRVIDVIDARWLTYQYPKSGIRCKAHIKVVIKLRKAKKKLSFRSDVKKCDLFELALEISIYFSIITQLCQMILLFFLLALKHKIIRGKMCAYLHYADNTNRKILAMFFVHNKMFKMHYSRIPWGRRIGGSPGVTTATADCLFTLEEATPWRVAMLEYYVLYIFKHFNPFLV